MKTKPRKKHRSIKGEGSLYLRGRMWWYQLPDGQAESTGKTIQSEAVKVKQERLAAHYSGQSPVKTKSSPATTVNELLDAHLAYMRLKNRASTQDVEWILKKHVRPYFGERAASSLATKDFDQYREDKKAEKLEPTTINRHLSYIRSGYMTGQKRRLVDFVPHFEMADESYNVRQGFLTFDGYEKVLAALPVSLKPLFVCGFHVSSRKSELQNLLWSQVDLEKGLIVLDPSQTKNKTGRALPIYGDMVNVLAAQKKLRDGEFPECEHVFFWHTEDAMIAHGGQRSVPGTHIKVFRKSWLKAVKAAGLPNLLFHDLRRSAERNMTEAGMDQAMRMKISGHKTPAMSNRYNIVTADQVATEKMKMDDWFKQQKAKTKK